MVGALDGAWISNAPASQFCPSKPGRPKPRASKVTVQSAIGTKLCAELLVAIARVIGPVESLAASEGARSIAELLTRFVVVLSPQVLPDSTLCPPSVPVLWLPQV